MIDALRLDHYALRVPDRDEATALLTAWGYTIVDRFNIVLADGSTAQSYALTHPFNPDVFVSSGPKGSKIQRWVEKRGGKGAVHHLAYHVDDVAAVMDDWRLIGVKFQSEEPLVCSCPAPLTQVFTEEDPESGLIYELITRNGHPGFCAENVARLMQRSPE